MAIPFTCICGKKLNAKDQFAGKKMRCPGCGKVLTIPETTSTPLSVPTAPTATGTLRPSLLPPLPEAAPPPPLELPDEVGLLPELPPPEPPAFVRFVCNCGRRLKSRMQDVGAEIDCPECGRTLAIPPSDTDDPPPPRSLPTHPWVDRSLSQTLTPWKDAETRRHGSDGPELRDEKAGSWLPACLLLLLVAGAGVALWFFLPRITAIAREKAGQVAGPPPATRLAELRLVPRDAAGTFTVWPADTRAAAHQGAGRKVNPELDQWVKDQCSRVGLPPELVGRLTLVRLPPHPPVRGKALPETKPWVYLVQIGWPISKEALANRLVPTPVKMKLGEHHYYVSITGTSTKDTTPRSLALHFVPDQPVYLVGDVESVRRVLRKKPHAVGQGLSSLPEMNQPASTLPLVVSLNQQDFLLTPTMPLLAGESATALVGTLSLQAAPRARLDLRLKFPDAAAARRAETRIRKEVAAELARIGQTEKALESERHLRAGLAVGHTLASLAAAQLSLAGPLPPVPAAPDAKAHPSAAAEAHQRAARKALLAEYGKGVSRDGKTVRLTLEAGPDTAGLLYAQWLPYLRSVADALLRPRPAPKVVAG